MALLVVVRIYTIATTGLVIAGGLIASPRVLAVGGMDSEVLSFSPLFTFLPR